MKRFRKMSNRRSTSKKAEAEKLTTQKVKFASLHEEEEDYDDEADAAARKTCKISSSKMFICSKCGKGFPSSKAMCGHMACHSGKDKASKNVVVVAKQKKKKKKQVVMMDSSLSDTEPGAKRLRRRTRRFKKHNFVADSKAKAALFNNCSSGDSGIEQEQEEVAISLMMLSRDSGNWGGWNSVGDSSENNSVVLEDRSVSTKLGKKSGLILGYDVNEATEKCRSQKIETYGVYGSGYVRNGAESVEEEANIRDLRRNMLEEGSKVGPHLSLEKLKSVMDCETYGRIQSSKMNSNVMNSALNECDGGGHSVRIRYSSAEMYKRFEHEVLINSHSHQPFHANVASHKSFSAAFPYKSVENRFETDKGKCKLEHDSYNVGDNWKKGTQACLAHSKVFRSGQATEEINCDQVDGNFKRNKTQLRHDFIDLNLPAPTEDEEANESMAATENSKTCQHFLPRSGSGDFYHNY